MCDAWKTYRWVPIAKGTHSAISTSLQGSLKYHLLSSTSFKLRTSAWLLMQYHHKKRYCNHWKVVHTLRNLIKTGFGFNRMSRLSNHIRTYCYVYMTSTKVPVALTPTARAITKKCVRFSFESGLHICCTCAVANPLRAFRSLITVYCYQRDATSGSCLPHTMVK